MRARREVIPDDAEAARESALRSLARRSLTHAEIIQRLTRRGYALETARSVADRLAEVGLINDEAVARSVVSNQIARGKSSRRWLAGKLRQRGVDAGRAEELAAETAAGRDVAADALAVALRRAKSLPPSLEPEVRQRRLLGALARLGFDAEIARSAVEHALSQDDAE